MNKNDKYVLLMNHEQKETQSCENNTSLTCQFNNVFLCTFVHVINKIHNTATEYFITLDNKIPLNRNTATEVFIHSTPSQNTTN